MRALKVEISGALLLEMCGIRDAQKIKAYAAWVSDYDTLSIVFTGDDPRLPEVERLCSPWPEGDIECTLTYPSSRRPGLEGKFVVLKKQHKP